MTVPGSNLLNAALTIIGKQRFFYYRFAARTLNPNGQDIAIYAPPTKMFGSIQAVPHTLYDQYGLDLQKHYIMVYVSLDVLDISRDVSGDMLLYKGRMFQFLSNTKWFQQDGWGGCVAAQVPNQSLIENVIPPVPNNYTTSESLTFTAEYSLPVTVTGTPIIDILIGATAQQAVYESGSGTAQLVFSYTVQSGDSGAVTLSIAAPGTSPVIDLTNGTLTSEGEDATPASIAFLTPNMAGVTANA